MSWKQLLNSWLVLPRVRLFATQNTVICTLTAHVNSPSGVQRNPLWPLSFPLAMWPIIIEIEINLPYVLQHNWFLDDGILCGSEQQLCSALKSLTNLGEGRCLELGTKKCDLWSPVDLNVSDNFRL